MTISPAQCRAARGLVELDQAELATQASVSRNTVVDFEKGRRTPNANNLAAIRRALETAGVEFIPENGGGPGVRLHKDQGKAGQVADYLASLVKANDVNEGPAKAGLAVYEYLASLRPKPKDFRSVRLHLLQLFWERVTANDLSEKIANTIENLAG